MNVPFLDRLRTVGLLTVLALLLPAPVIAVEVDDPFVQAYLAEHPDNEAEILSPEHVLRQVEVRLERIDGPVHLLRSEPISARGWNLRRTRGSGRLRLHRLRFVDEATARTVFEALRQFGVEGSFGLSKAWDHVALVGPEIVWLGVVACGFEGIWREALGVLQQQRREAGLTPAAAFECHCGSSCVDVEKS